MTSFEHAMLAINGCMAAGLHKRYGWRIAAMAACSAVAPDWDGLTLLGGAALFDRGHRVWGHNLLGCVLLGVLLGACDYRFDIMGRVAGLLRRVARTPWSHHDVRADRQRTVSGYVAWSVVAVLTALSHLAADLVFSGGAGLSDWELQLGWPFSTRGFTYPLVRWGDVGVTVILVVGAFAMHRWPAHMSLIAGITLALVLSYVAFRGTVVGGTSVVQPWR